LKGGKKGQGAVKAEESKTTGTKSSTKSGGTAKAPEEPEEAPKKPDTRTLIGGASWTGKLPLNLLSEVCQKQKWHKPDYTMVRQVIVL
jgi:ATP-dependent RNA helicase DHX57